ncbi:hypothetical protein ATANTOWER_003404 [Ataeniobius toweri]|uniref:Secreted protein n=1 Tax=Ataeniobius toweri TaxID=208326 RepID=A0ABU7A9M1_9TELE|nr:hypothetical protein [Ataeniobius toweri]
MATIWFTCGLFYFLYHFAPHKQDIGLTAGPPLCCLVSYKQSILRTSTAKTTGVVALSRSALSYVWHTVLLPNLPSPSTPYSMPPHWIAGCLPLQQLVFTLLRLLLAP